MVVICFDAGKQLVVAPKKAPGQLKGGVRDKSIVIWEGGGGSVYLPRWDRGHCPQEHWFGLGGAGPWWAGAGTPTVHSSDPQPLATTGGRGVGA